jgi:glycosyltransferase involved in cell wall biosynthesis
MDPLPISVIIPTRNVEKTLEECLVSVQKNNPTEIIIVDGLSADLTLKIARKYTQLIYSDDGKGASFAHQLGVEKATQPYIAYVDADIVLQEGSLGSLLNELIGTQYASMAAAIIPASINTYWERAIDWNAKLLRARRKTGGLQATVLRKDIVLKYGFDSNIIYGDDLDFITRVQRDGHKLGISSVSVYHHHRAHLRDMYKARRNQSRAIPRLIKKYGFWHPRFWPPLVTAYWICVCIIKGKPNYIPYFIVNGVAQTAGMIKGFFELTGESCKKFFSK